MDGPDQPRVFDDHEVDAILRRAIERQGSRHGAGKGGLSRADLVETARQLGVDAGQVDQAIAEEDAQRAAVAERQEWKAQAWAGFRAHLTSFVMVNALLLGIDLLTPGGPWFHWPLLFWGFGLLMQLLGAVRGPTAADLDRQRRRHERRQARERERVEREERRARKKAQQEALKKSAEALGEAVTDGVRSLLDGLGEGLRKGAGTAAPPRVRVDPDAGDRRGEAVEAPRAEGPAGRERQRG